MCLRIVGGWQRDGVVHHAHVTELDDRPWAHRFAVGAAPSRRFECRRAIQTNRRNAEREPTGQEADDPDKDEEQARLPEILAHGDRANEPDRRADDEGQCPLARQNGSAVRRDPERCRAKGRGDRSDGERAVSPILCRIRLTRFRGASRNITDTVRCR